MSDERNEPDLLVIGGGTAGMAAAGVAARGGAHVVLVTDSPPGGDCTFTGCVPSKTLIAAAAAGRSYADAAARVQAAVERVAATETADVLRSKGIDVRMGSAAFTAPRVVDVDGTVLRPARIVVASGSGPSIPPIDGLADTPYLTNESVFDLAALPRQLVVLGGGAIGCELAQAFRRLGSEVTLVEGADRLLGKEEPRASAVVQAALETDGVVVCTGVSVARVDPVQEGIRLTLDGGSTISASTLLVAVGRRPLTDRLQLDRAGIEVGKDGRVVTDARLRTTAQDVWAAGDVTGLLPFTHAADVMGRLAGGNAMDKGRGGRFSTTGIPWVTFTDPEVGRVGLTEAQAAEQVKGARVVELAMDDVDRAITAGRTEGFVKLVVGPQPLLGNTAGGRVLGATVVCPSGGELVAEIALAIRTRMFAGRLAQTTHAYPTWSLAVQQCAAQLFGYGGSPPRPAQA